MTESTPLDSNERVTTAMKRTPPESPEADMSLGDWLGNSGSSGGDAVADIAQRLRRHEERTETALRALADSMKALGAQVRNATDPDRGGALDDLRDQMLGVASRMDALSSRIEDVSDSLAAASGDIENTRRQIEAISGEDSGGEDANSLHAIAQQIDKVRKQGDETSDMTKEKLASFGRRMDAYAGKNDETTRKVGHAVGVIAERIDALETRVREQAETIEALQQAPQPAAFADMDISDDRVAPYIAAAERDLARPGKTARKSDLFDKIAAVAETKYETNRRIPRSQPLANSGEQEGFFPSVGVTRKKRATSTETAETTTDPASAAAPASDAISAVEAVREQLGGYSAPPAPAPEPEAQPEPAPVMETAPDPAPQFEPAVEHYAEPDLTEAVQSAPTPEPDPDPALAELREELAPEDDHGAGGDLVTAGELKDRTSEVSIRKIRGRLRDSSTDMDEGEEEQSSGGSLLGKLFKRGKKSAQEAEEDLYHEAFESDDEDEAPKSRKARKKKAAPEPEIDEYDDEEDELSLFDEADEDEEPRRKGKRRAGLLGRASKKSRRNSRLEEDDDEDEEFDDYDDEDEDDWDELVLEERGGKTRPVFMIILLAALLVGALLLWPTIRPMVLGG